MIYLFLEEPSTNIARVKNRVIGGGHDIPKADIIRRFYRSKNLFCELYRDIVSSWSIYYNANEIFEKVADNRKILDTQKYNKFKEDTKCK